MLLTQRRQSRKRRKPPKIPGTKLRTADISNFTGGWNAVSDDVNLATRYAVVLRNFYRDDNNNQTLRYGTRYFADIKNTISGNLLNVAYHNGRIISVTDDGELASVLADGSSTAIWTEAIANALAGNPSGWTDPITLANYVPHKTNLIVHNGIDKPITINSSFVVTYLADDATGSNTNVPIGKFGVVVGDYHCVAGVGVEPTVVYIASKGTAGTFPGDPAPNDSISIDVGTYAPSDSDEIRGLGAYRNQLVVFFKGTAVLFTLGVYDDDGNHTPQPSDTIPTFGLLGQRSVVPVIKADLMFADVGGINSAKRNLFAGLVDTDRLSDSIAPAYQSNWTEHTLVEQQEETFGVYNRLDNQSMFFEPDGNAYVLTFDSQFRRRTWSEFTGWTWTCACSSALGRIYFGEGTKIFQYGNGAFAGEDFSADRENDHDSEWASGVMYSIGDLVWDVDTEQAYMCAIAHTSPTDTAFAGFRDNNPNHWELYEGEEISFDWELPWTDASQRMNLKRLGYLTISGSGTAAFTVECYVDKLYKNDQGTVVFDPALSLEFVGGSSGGFGLPVAPPHMGGGRISNEPRLWSYPVKFKMIKFRIRGAARRPLTISALHVLYAVGSYKRAGGL